MYNYIKEILEIKDKNIEIIGEIRKEKIKGQTTSIVTLNLNIIDLTKCYKNDKIIYIIKILRKDYFKMKKCFYYFGAFLLSMSLGMSFDNHEANASAAGPKTTNVYRLHNYKTGKKLYTINTTEVSNLTRNGWKNEGIAWQTLNYFQYSGGTSAVYRLYDPKSGDRLYIANSQFISGLVSKGWRNQGVAWYTHNTGSAVYLLRDKTGRRVYLTNTSEIRNKIASGWKNEGIAFRAYSPNLTKFNEAPKPVPNNIRYTRDQVEERADKIIADYKDIIQGTWQSLDGSYSFTVNFRGDNFFITTITNDGKKEYKSTYNGKYYIRREHLIDEIKRSEVQTYTELLEYNSYSGPRAIILDFEGRRNGIYYKHAYWESDREYLTYNNELYGSQGNIFKFRRGYEFKVIDLGGNNFLSRGTYYKK